MAEKSKILVIGAGGLGCEILKNLALSGVKNIHVIDLDRVDITNLNRQFLFRKENVGDFKAKAAADFVKKRVPGVKITPYTDPIQEYGSEFYEYFDVVIGGLDNVEARSWLNKTLHDLVKFDPETKKPILSTVIPYIDGGSEGFKGQARVILPHISGCFECTLSLIPKTETYPMCTIRETPRIPEHCI